MAELTRINVEYLLDESQMDRLRRIHEAFNGSSERRGKRRDESVEETFRFLMTAGGRNTIDWRLAFAESVEPCRSRLNREGVR